MWHFSGPAHVDDCLREVLRRLLWQIVSHAATNRPMFVSARELAGVNFWIGMRGAVGVALQGDGRHRDLRSAGESGLHLVILGFAFGEAETPTVVVDHNCHMVGIVESGSTALERSVVERPFRGRSSPDQAR